MSHQPRSMRPFIGARDFEQSRRFYLDLGFQEHVIDPKMSFFQDNGFGFYLQDAYVKDWVDNTMVFLEVEDVEESQRRMSALNLPATYPGVRLSTVKDFDWGREFYLHDPSGILWHIGAFASKG